MPAPIRLRSRPADGPVLLRASGGPPEVQDDRRLVFYAAVFNRYSQPITEGGRTFREVIRPGAFTQSLAAGGDVYACVEHARVQTFATRADGSLLLAEDARGLFATCYLGERGLPAQVLADVRAGAYRGCSFAFRTITDRTTAPKPGGPPLPLVELLAVELIDVSLVRNPAYPATVFSLRSDGARTRERRLRLLKLRGA